MTTLPKHQRVRSFDLDNYIETLCTIIAVHPSKDLISRAKTTLDLSRKWLNSIKEDPTGKSATLSNLQQFIVAENEKAASSNLQSHAISKLCESASKMEVDGSGDLSSSSKASTSGNERDAIYCGSSGHSSGAGPSGIYSANSSDTTNSGSNSESQKDKVLTRDQQRRQAEIVNAKIRRRIEQVKILDPANVALIKELEDNLLDVPKSSAELAREYDERKRAQIAKELEFREQISDISQDPSDIVAKELRFVQFMITPEFNLCMNCGKTPHRISGTKCEIVAFERKIGQAQSAQQIHESYISSFNVDEDSVLKSVVNPLLEQQRFDCKYVLCSAGRNHHTSVCRTLQSRCKKCLFRGHQENSVYVDQDGSLRWTCPEIKETPDRKMSGHTLKTLQGEFEKAANEGFLTKHRYAMPACGFFPLRCPEIADMAKSITYYRLLASEIQKALDVIRQWDLTLDALHITTERDDSDWKRMQSVHRQAVHDRLSSLHVDLRKDKARREVLLTSASQGVAANPQLAMERYDLEIKISKSEALLQKLCKLEAVELSTYTAPTWTSSLGPQSTSYASAIRSADGQPRQGPSQRSNPSGGTAVSKIPASNQASVPPKKGSGWNKVAAKQSSGYRKRDLSRDSNAPKNKKVRFGGSNPTSAGGKSKANPGKGKTYQGRGQEGKAGQPVQKPSNKDSKSSTPPAQGTGNKFVIPKTGAGGQKLTKDSRINTSSMVAGPASEDPQPSTSGGQSGRSSGKLSPRSSKPKTSVDQLTAEQRALLDRLGIP